MDAFVTVAQITLGLAALLAVARAIKGPAIVDRIVAVDLILLLLAAGVGAEAARAGSEVYSAIAIVVALVAFVGTVLVARFVEWRDVE
jgi:multicomponent Na+:H+ antiporter subunit F